MFAQIGLSGDFLRLKETRTLFRDEQHFPSVVFQRGETDGATEDTFQRARGQAELLLSQYTRPENPNEAPSGGGLARSEARRNDRPAGHSCFH